MVYRSLLWACLVVSCVVLLRPVDALINDRCNDATSDNDACNIKHAYCQLVNEKYGLCTCSKGYTTSSNGRECLQVLGQTNCSPGSTECHVVHSTCDVIARHCVCRRGFLASRDKTRCLPPLGRSCVDNSECLAYVANSICSRGSCACSDQYVALNSATACVPLLGKRCDADVDCAAIHDSSCDNGVCACRSADHVASLNKTMCLPLVREILGPCEVDSQCANRHLGEDTYCLNRQCSCRYGNTRTNHSCEKRRVLNDRCNHTQQCQMIAHASCVHHECSCDPFYVPHATDRVRCVPMVLSYGAGAPCEHDAQCSAGFGSASRCTAGTCQCIEGHHFTTNDTSRCVQNKGITQRCAQQDDCYLPLDGATQTIECVNSACACKSGFKPSQGSDSCISGSSPLRACVSVIVLLSYMLQAWHSVT